MRAVTIFLLLGAAFVLSGCASKFRSYDGPEVTHIVAYKDARRMFLMHEGTILTAYNFELGFAPTGDKEISGDGRTPEGRYFIDRKNPNSQFYLSIGISYPNAADRAHAAALGESPGGDIFIHGTPRRFRGTDDWTWGCLAVTDREMEEIYAMVEVGTPIVILP
ncbi:MAG: L,D-transpeptidase family protein [Pseudomonadota bacterium]